MAGLRALRGLLGRLGAPVLSQGITAGTSLLLQVLAARALGLAEYGAFAVYLAVLVSATALYTGYVGDSLAVLDRRDPRIRSALSASALIGLALCFAAGLVTSLVLRHGDYVAALLYAVMLVGWLVEETFRRVLIARQEFWKLVWNDTGYLLGTAVALGAWFATGAPVTLPMLFAAMGVGTITAIALGFAQVPPSESRGVRPGFAGLAEVAAFAGWRSLHATLRPAAQLAARVLVANLVSFTAVGMLEAGRLLIAPLQVVVNGAGGFLLAGFAAGERKGRADHGLARRAAVLLTGATVLGGLVLTVFAHPLGTLLTGQPVDPVLLLGWVAYLAVWAVGLPYVTEVVARKLARTVFAVRLVDSVVGLGLAAAALVLGWPVAAVPWLLTVGGVYSAWRLGLIALRTREAPGDEKTVRIDLEATMRFPPV
ncbi:hypothetical protein [Amycolatopsis sp. CA-230715]|uniref:hypothetical protein n=1 Tax=Amycolatopsis sp. CA-230715 TaxID=2745196 RepID=UPI001C33D122|nr:hypothetical protein [Amycolatopsis sp. CA-230715]QWF84190.1 hypothetical protein HUW46_07638 [Amycolatopsis sp. CA-230715]